MIARQAAGLRVIAPDNVGFGRSDKPADPTDYTFARHVDWMHSLVTGLELSGVTLVVQDWGGPIGFSVLALAGQLTWAHHRGRPGGAAGGPARLRRLLPAGP